MSASIGACGCMIKVLNLYSQQLLRESKYMPRALTQLQLTRERRRSCHPPRWFVQRKIDSGLYKQELTRDNREFLQEITHDLYSEKVEEEAVSPLKEGPWARNEWTMGSMRTGVLGIKLGSIPQWKKDGTKIHTTMYQVLDNHVINYVPPEEYVKSMGYQEHWRKKMGMVVVGALSCEPHLFSRAYNNLFAKSGLPPKRKLTRFLVTADTAVQPGTPLYATHFKVGDYVDVQAKTIGHGFQGVVKRWGFKGGPASHGTTKFHRRPGNIGGGRGNSKVWKGRKLPGHMGMDWRPLKGLRIWRINTKYNILYVHGSLTPGPTHCYTRIMDTQLPNRRLVMMEDPPLMPTFYPGDAPQPMPEDIYHEELFQFTEPTITFDQVKS